MGEIKEKPNLQDRGFRYIYRDGCASGDEFLWVPPQLMLANDIDCTDMDVVEFEKFVSNIGGAK